MRQRVSIRTACLLSTSLAIAALPGATLAQQDNSSDVTPSAQQTGIKAKLTTPPGNVSNTELAAPAGKAMEQIIVLGQRTPARIARQAQKEAPNLILVQPYQEIRKLPDVSAAEAVRRIPGISLETDEGEGRYVNIRGFDADLNSTTFGGLRLPPTNNASPFGGYRAVTLDSIPVGLIGALTVTNSNTPEMDAEALGGTIEITPKTVPPGDKPFFAQGDLGTGYEPLRSTGIANANLTTGGRYGPFSMLLTGSYYEDSRGIDDVEPSYFNAPPLPYQAVNNIGQRDYQLNRWRHAYGVTLGYDPDPDNKYYIRAFDAGYTERYDRQILSITPDGNATQNAAGIITDTLNATDCPPAPAVCATNANGGLGNSVALQKQLRDEKETSLDRIVTIGGRNILGNSDILDYHVGYTIGTYHKPYDFNSTFSYQPGAGENAIINYSPTGRGNTPLYGITGADYLNPNKYVLTGFNNSKADNYDREQSAVINYQHNLSLLSGDDEYFKVGLSARLRHKRTTAQPLSYDNLGSPVLASIAGSPNESYYSGQYQNGVDIQQTYLQNLYGPGTISVAADRFGITDPRLLALLPAANVIGADQQYLNVRENVYAGYGEYHATFGRLGVLAGVRVEVTRDKSTAYSTSANATFPDAIVATFGQPQGNGLPQLLTFPDGTTAPASSYTDPATGNLVGTGYTSVTRFSKSTHYSNVFPSIQFRYEIQPNLIARLAWSSTIARPGFNQSNPALSVDLGSGTVATGNPNLKPATADSFDLSFEKYLPNSGIVSVGFFDKEISNYIVATQLNSNSNISGFPGIPANIPLRIVTYANAPSSYARGVEFNYDQHFRFLPGWLSGFGGTANYTFVDSQFEIRPGEFAPLPSTSQHTWNLGIYYEDYGFNARLSAYSASADLFAIGGDKTGDVYNATRTSLDFGSSYAFAPNWVVYFNAKNLLNTPHTFYQQTENRPIQREFYLQTFQLGVRFDY